MQAIPIVLAIPIPILTQAIPSSGPGSGLPPGQIREDQPKQANMKSGFSRHLPFTHQITLNWPEPRNLEDWAQNNCFLSLSPGNHESSANQPPLFLPNSDEQHHGQGEAGKPLLQ